MADDRFEKFGRPAKKDTEKKTRKVLMSFTEKEYEKMLKYRDMFNKKTLTSTLEYLIERGEEKIRNDLERLRG